MHTLFDFAAVLQVEPAELLPRLHATETIKNLDSLGELARNFVTETIESGKEGAEPSWLSDEEK